MKILMLLQKLDIGGAETHVIDLAAGLTRQGHSVSICSNGGDYETQLPQIGVKHYKLPMHNKNLLNTRKALKRLAQIIREGDFDIIHAHARIPAFVCSLLKRRMRFNFVTTAHWVFRVNPLYKLITNWGERCIAVSSDIKQYVVDNYGYPPQNVSLTINGIDMERYRKLEGGDEIKRRLGIPADKKIILHVSRIDSDRSMASFLLTQAMVKLADESLRLVILGSGDEFDKLQREVEKANSALGYKAIYTLGTITNVQEYMPIADIFVGVSRAALEAMSAELPLILAGNEGYIGILNDDNLDKAIESNFCCRDCELSDADKLARDIPRLLSMPLEEIGKRNREIIEQHYSVDRMCGDYMQVYDKLLSDKCRNVMISGYYGFGNSGDDALLSAIIDEIKAVSPKANVTVLSNTPAATRKIYGTDSIYRYNFLKIRKQMKQTDLLITGGGSLIQDGTSNRSLTYYLSLIALAYERGARNMLYANGIGPVRQKNMPRIAETLNHVQAITLREPNSLALLNEIGVTRPKIEVTVDPVFNLVDKLNIKKPQNRGKYFVVSVRSFSGGVNLAAIAQAIDHTHEKYGCTPVYIIMQPQKDNAITHKLRAMTKCGGDIVGASNIKELLSLIRGAELCLAMRLHTLIYAASLSCPCIGIVYNPKVNAVLEYLQQQYYVDADGDYAEKLTAFIDEIVGNRKEIVTQLNAVANEIKQKSARDRQIMSELL